MTDRITIKDVASELRRQGGHPPLWLLGQPTGRFLGLAQTGRLARQLGVA